MLTQYGLRENIALILTRNDLPTQPPPPNHSHQKQIKTPSTADHNVKKYQVNCEPNDSRGTYSRS